MTICLCEDQPDRNDDHAKDGYSALCEEHKSQSGDYARTRKLQLSKRDKEKIEKI